MFKVVKKNPFTKEEWTNYILWRNYNFSKFESVDSRLRKSQFIPKIDEDWEFSISIGTILTDVISNKEFAEKYCKRQQNCVVVEFDYIDDIKVNMPLSGYDILDGELSYSLLTNFGNGIKVVNSVLAKNALIRHVEQAREVHNWFLINMANDNHVKGSKIIAVYGSV